MREPFAENRFTLTKELFSEGMRRTSQEYYRKTLKRALLGLALLWLVLSAYTLWRSGSLSYMLMELGVLAAVFLWLAVLLPRSKTRRAYKAMENAGVADAERCTRFYEEHLEVEVGGKLRSFPYREIGDCLQTERLLLLIMKDKTGVLLRRDAFTKGTEEAVLHRIEQAQEEEEVHD